MATKTSPEAVPLQHYVLKLFVTGASLRSQRAIKNLSIICSGYLKNRCVLEVVDIHRHPEEASQAEILACPTLIRESPVPMRRMIGDLSDPERLLTFLNLPPQGEVHVQSHASTSPVR